ncbi:DUF3846 domain-containing protein [Bacillus subtilis]|uniref:DUF3846 domain-containing protein n=1 Tax=Bacillus subtilis TaxID=1423 RepID=UPI00225077E3|nr:DUF3846 domain-containing protein [Bacillus subtilis]MCX4074739.1 DUF3846 domain-containing protein [Bacillus subtilis]MEC0395666.1 DUF3846 domain-containing protein [Bacillus subtilis]WBC28215.1 DUF3846 domain-containing protein [Bacillus subtilis]
MRKAILVDHQKNRIIEFPSSLQERQKIVGADFLNVVRLSNNIDLWYDDEGANKQLDYLSEITEPNGDKHVLFGSYLVTSVNDEGETIGLSAEQIKYFSTFGYRVWKKRN